MSIKKAELLAPAGNMESLKAAVAGGCDAVYMGLTCFSARAFAGNFTHEQFQEAIAYCHPRDVRIYVTINTMLHETEMENVRKEVAFLYENDVDGILVQDLGLFHLIRTCYPDLDVHCSTQMHIHNLNGVRKMQAEGAARVVLARETPLSLIKEAVKTGVEVEVFVYGAICISYSGQCLFSAAVKNRSANRGMCAQCCRLQYFRQDGSHFPQGDYILSPKDLNVIDSVPKLLEAGVASLKIEGRMKRPEYVYLVTKTFREAIDAWYAGIQYHVSKERDRQLKLMFNRGFSKGHLFGDDVNARMSQYRPNHRGITIGSVISCTKGKVTVKLSDVLHQHDGLRILSCPKDIGLQAGKIEKNGKLVSQGNPGDTVVLTVPADAGAKKGDCLQKTTDVKLIEAVDQCIAESRRCAGITLTCTGKVNAPLTITLQDDRGNRVTVMSEQPCQKPQKAPLSIERIQAALVKTGDLALCVDTCEINCEPFFLPISVLNETRRKAMEQLVTMRTVLHERTGMQPYQINLKNPGIPEYRLIVHSDEALTCRMEGVWNVTDGRKENGVMPVVCEDYHDTEPLHHCILSSMGDFLADHDRVVAGMTCNIANSYAVAYFLKQGCEAVILSSEVSDEQCTALIQAFVSRYGFVPPVYKPVYGRRKIMYIKDCFTQCNSDITDLHGNFYKVERENGITMINEPDVYTDTNTSACGSYLILSSGQKNGKEILEEAYEEISERIQGVHQ